MTFQIQHQLIFNNKSYSFDFFDEPPFYLSDFNIETTMASTACYRGYKLICEIVNDKLFIQELRLREKNKSNILFFGNKGKHLKTTEDPLFNKVYEKLSTPISYTGKIYIADEEYNSVLQKTIETRYELTFYKGELIQVNER